MKIVGESVEASLEEALYLDSIHQPWDRDEDLWASIRQGFDNWNAEVLQSSVEQSTTTSELGDSDRLEKPVVMTISKSQQKLLKFMIRAEISEDEAAARSVEGDVDMSLSGLVMKSSTPDLINEQILRLRRVLLGRSLLQALEANNASDLQPS